MTPISYTILEARKLTGLGNTKIYEEINSGRLKAKKCGKRTLISHAALEEWMNCLEGYPVRPLPN